MDLGIIFIIHLQIIFKIHVITSTIYEMYV